MTWRDLDLEHAFPSLFRPPEMGLHDAAEARRTIAHAFDTIAASSENWWPPDDAASLGEDALAEDIERNPNHLYLLASGEWEVVRRLPGQVSPLIMRVGRGEILNARGLRGMLEARIPIPRTSDAPEVHVRMIRRGKALRVDPSQLVGLLSEAERPKFEQRLRTIHVADVLLERLTEALRSHPLFGREPLVRLARLIRSAVFFYHVAEEIEVENPTLGDMPSKNAGMYILTQGALEVQLKGGGPSLRLSPWKPLFTLDVQDIRSVTPRGGETASGFRLPIDTIRDLFHGGEAFRRRVLQTALPGTATWKWARAYDRISVELVAFRDRNGHHFKDDTAWARSMADGLASQLRRYDDRALCLHVREGDSAPVFDRATDTLHVCHDAMPRPGPACISWVRAHLNHWLHDLLGEYDYVLATVQTGGRASADFARGLEHQADTLIDIVDRPPHEWRLEPGDDREPWDVSKVLSVYVAGPERAQSSTEKRPWASVNQPLRWVRVRRDELVFHRRDLARLARALSGRLVGVALGGGGSLGLANVVLLEALTGRGEDGPRDIPVDIVSTNSFGSVVGAYYCTAEHDANGVHPGLQRLRSLEGRLWIQAATLGATIARGLVEWLVDRELGPVDVQDTIIRYLPFAVRAESLEPVIVEGATVGEAVSASGAAPAAFAPVEIRGERFVDGAVIANVPVEHLLQAGCGLVVAMDPIPRPVALGGRRPDRRGLPSRALRVARAMDPLGIGLRIFDGVRAFERALSLMSEGAARQADVSLKLPTGTALRMPFFVMTTPVFARTEVLLRESEALAEIRAHYRRMWSPIEARTDPVDADFSDIAKRAKEAGIKRLEDSAEACGRPDLRAPWAAPHRRAQAPGKG